MSTPSPSSPLVSVVTPAYNEEKLLSECIESVLAQTYTNWEYTIVDNCSTDATGEVAQRYAAKDARIRVVRNDACIPAVKNFNLALRQVSPASKYCKMVLADDIIFPECLARMVGLMEEHPSIGVTSAYGISSRWVLWGGLAWPQEFFSGRDVCRQRLLGGPYVFGSQTSVLYRSQLVRSRDPFYNEASMHPDSEACFDLLKESDFGFVFQVLTFSRDDRPGGMLSRAWDLNTAAAGALHELVTYGPFYLEPAEYNSCLKTTVEKYYDFLVTGLIERRDKEFWEYHKKKLAASGVGFSRARLAYSLSSRIVSRVLGKRLPPKWGL